MRSSVLLLSVCLFLTGCGLLRKPVKEVQRDSVRVSYREVVHLDTIEVAVPYERVVEHTLDTCSVLETQYARSEASVSGGVLSHLLETKDTPIQMPVASTTAYRDSIVYQYREVEKQVEVEKELTWWQRVRLDTWALLFFVICVSLIWKLSKNFITL